MQLSARNPTLHQLETALTRGLTIVLPLAATLWILRYLFVTIDAFFQPTDETHASLPGLGLLTILTVALVVGFAARSRLLRRPFDSLERGIARVPVVRLIHGTIKDVFDALLGRKKRFDKPVLVRLGGGIDGEIIGFVTAEDLSVIGRPGLVAVYFPQSYNIAGSLIMLERDRLQPLDLDPGSVMSFVMSGGVAEVHERNNHAHSGREPLGAGVTPERLGAGGARGATS